MDCKEGMKLKNKVILFGAGISGRELLRKISRDNVAFFVDNNPNLIGCLIDDIEVISVSQLKGMEALSNYEIVITSEKYFMEINEQLNSIGISNTISISHYLIKSKFYSDEGKKRIILANTHMGTNMGDHLITISELKFFDCFFPEYAVIELTADEIEERFEIIKKYIKNDDIVAISGGGYMGSLWLTYGEANVRLIVSELPHNKIIILPQSIYFENSTDGIKQLRISKNVYDVHKKLTICLREPRQANYVKGIFSENVRIKIYPDMVLFMEQQRGSSKRDKVGICFRSDKESVITEKDRECIIDTIKDATYCFDMHADKPIMGLKRNEYIQKYIEMVSGFKYVITDRLHCMLLCLITGTPCIAFDNLTGKLSAVHQWISDCENINIVSSQNEIEKYIKKYSNNVESKLYDWSATYKKFEELSGEFR